jgi:amidase
MNTTLETDPGTADTLADATELLRALAGHEVSAVDLCNAAITRIEQRDGAINAVVVRDFERSREQARAADAALAAGERRPLLGLPMTVKESFNIAGLPKSWGFERARDLRPTEDAVAVARLKAAGAVILGKTNVPVGLADWQTVNPIHGRTQHPLDASRTPGGSSGGAAAALASGMVALELGSDIGGSIRVPAHFCGVFGHKPSHGLLPSRGHDFPGDAGAQDALSVIGPLARSARDLDLALGVLAGPDFDRAAYRLELPAPRCAGAAQARVLVLATHPSARVSSEVGGAVQAAADGLARAGAKVRDGLALLPDLAALHGAYQAALLAIISRGMPAEMAPPGISAHVWLGLLDERARLQLRFRELFEAWDIVLMPAFGTAAFKHVDEPVWGRRVLPIDGHDTPYGDQAAWAGIASFVGLPATVAPVATTREGLPIGVQIVGPMFGDRTTISAAGWLEALRR